MSLKLTDGLRVVHMVTKLEEEFSQYAGSIRRKRRNRFFRRWLVVIALWHFLVPHLLGRIAASNPQYIDAVLRTLDRMNLSDNPMNPENRNANSSRPLP